MEINRQIHDAIEQFVDDYKNMTRHSNAEQQLGEWLQQKLNVPRVQANEFKKYKKTQKSFSKINMVLPTHFTAIVHEPFGSQSKPDLAIFYGGRAMMIDVKTGKSGKPTLNSVPPRTDEFIIFINTNFGNEAAFAVSGADLIGDVDVNELGGNANNLHNILHTQHMSPAAQRINGTILRHSNLSFYGRAMYNVKNKITRSSPKFFADVLNYDWTVTSLPDVHTFDGEEDNE
jgi:hypothetical protein